MEHVPPYPSPAVHPSSPPCPPRMRTRHTRTRTHARHTRMHATRTHTRTHAETGRTACHQPSGTHRQNAPITLLPTMPKHVTHKDTLPTMKNTTPKDTPTDTPNTTPKDTNTEKQPWTERYRVTKAQQAEVIALRENGASVQEIQILLHLTENQVKRALQSNRSAQTAELVAESIQLRQTSGSVKSAQLSEACTDASRRIIARIQQLISEETDVSKLATALKVLHGIAQTAEVKTEVSKTLSRLR